MKAYKGERVDEYGHPIEKSKGKTVFNAVMIALSVLVYAVIFLRLFEARGWKKGEVLLLDSFAERQYAMASLGYNPSAPLNLQKPHTMTYELVMPSTTMDGEGRAQVRPIYYARSLGHFQLCIQLNTSVYDKESYDFYLKGLSTEGETRYYPLSYSDGTQQGRYRFLRLCFDEVFVSEGETLRLIMLPEGAAPESSSYFSLKVYSSDLYKEEKALEKISKETL